MQIVPSVPVGLFLFVNRMQFVRTFPRKASVGEDPDLGAGTNPGPVLSTLCMEYSFVVPPFILSLR